MNTEICLNKVKKYLLMLKKGKKLKTISEFQELNSVIEYIDSMSYQAKVLNGKK